MGIAGYNAVIKKSGDETVFTDEAMSTVAGSTETAGTHWQIDDATKNVFDRLTLPAFGETTSSTIAGTDVTSINYLFGKVIFATTHPTVVVTGEYLPLVAVGGAHAYTLTQQNDVLDDTDFTTTGFRSHKLGLQTVELSITRWDSLEMTFVHDLMGRTTSTGSTLPERPARIPVVAEVQPGGTTHPTARGFFVTEAENRSGDVSALESADVSLQLDGSPKGSFIWSDQ